uniref:Uncharacterized protein n=1 Tax=Tanacetum cinerariifolium TaxID=118510 RepID=A0A6L2L0I7_TANCI|nr:hypothetical protein [Tanacetum cinerariifolium]
METKDVHAIKYKMSKAKERCMTYFRSLHSHLQVLCKEDLKGTRIEHGFKREFMPIFGQDDDTFTSTMLLNTRIEVKRFRETLLQHMSNVKKSVAERTRHKRLYDRRINKRQMQTQESKVDLGKELDTSLVVTESNGIESEKQDTRSKSWNDADVDNADIKPVYDKEPMAEVQLTAECNIFATGQQYTKQSEIIIEGRIKGIFQVGFGERAHGVLGRRCRKDLVQKFDNLAFLAPLDINPLYNRTMKNWQIWPLMLNFEIMTNLVLKTFDFAFSLIKTLINWQERSLDFESLSFEASFLDCFRKLPVDPAFAADFQSCVDIVWFLTDF